MTNKKGFTLVELLVVISIIALLLSILMPSLNKARLAAQRVVCGNGNKQMILLQLTYATDCKGKFPPFKSSEPWVLNENWQFNPQYAPATLAVHEYYKPYFKAGLSKALICPATARFAKEDNATWGMFGKTTWFNNTGSGVGAWDAVSSAAPSYCQTKSYRSVWIPYNWFMGYEWPHPIDDSHKLEWQGGEKPWATNLAEASSKNAAVAHIYNSSSNHDALKKYRDLSHGGNCLKWGASPERQTNDRKNGTVDNPVGYGDGHVEIHIRPTASSAYKTSGENKMRIRVYYPSKVGQTSVCY